ncbi:VanZ family protein [Terrisporobacter sp.]
MGVYDIFTMISRWALPSILLVLAVFGISLVSYKFIYKKIFKGKKEVSIYQFVLFVILIGYLFLVFAMTGLSRADNFSNNTINLNFLSGYLDVWYSWSLTPLLLLILNILMLAPLGFLLPLISKKFDSAKNVLLVAFTFTVFIELFQLITHRGIFELDDLFHNTIGSMIGYFIVKVFLEFKESKKVRKNTIIKALIIPAIYIVVFSGAIVVYNNKEFGNLNVSPFEHTDVSNVKISSDIDFSDKDDKASVFYNVNSNKKKRALDIIKILNDSFNIPPLKKSGMDGDNIQYIFDTTSNSMYTMTYFSKDGTWSLNNQLSDNMKNTKLSDSNTQKIEEVLKIKNLLPDNATLKYDENNFLRWDAKKVNIKNCKRDFINGIIMISNSDSRELQNFYYEITDNKYVRDIEIISPKEAFEKVKKGNFYSYNPYNLGDEIKITNFEISYMYDSKGYYKPVYKFTGSVNKEKDTFSAIISASK